MRTLKIGNGTRKVSGEIQEIPGYTQRMGDTIAGALRRYESLELLAIGPEAVNVMVKAIARAQNILVHRYNKNLIAESFQIKTTQLNTGRREYPGRVTSITVRIV